LTPTVHIRALEATDSFEELTALLHRAYAPLADLGFRYLATHQDVETTRGRAAKGECYVMLDARRIIGTILLIPPSSRALHCEWYDRPEVSVLSQFAVEPDLQGRGLGSRLLGFAETRAARLGATEASVDTAENATHLIQFYEARGYRRIGHAQWGHTNYRSLLLSKRLDAPAEEPR
jgi:GNAT superfamily N-acetyltransferase